MDAQARSAPPSRFEFDGGALCLDFSNTWEHRDQPGDDRLENYAALVDFAVESGGMDPSRAEGLRREAAQDPVRADAVFARAVALREAIYRVFSARAACDEFNGEDVATINRELQRGLRYRQLVSDGDGVEWGWAGDELDAPLGPVAWSAGELLASDQLDRIRECDAGDCNWLFLDQSRSRSRRWCSMKSCGNRAKARRHYRRSRKQ